MYQTMTMFRAMLETISQRDDLDECDDVRITSTMRELGRMTKTNSFGDVAQFLNEDIDPYGVIRAGIVGLDVSSYPQGWTTNMWFFEWCHKVVSLSNVPTGLFRHYVRLFIEHMILPRAVADDRCLALDALAPVVFVCIMAGGSCDILPIEAVHANFAGIRERETFVMMNNYIVSIGNPGSISVYISYIIHGFAHTACADIMIHNGMVSSIDGVTLIHLIDGWFSTERDGTIRILRHVIHHSVYHAIIARDYLMNTSRSASSRVVGQLADVVTTALPYMTFDFTNMDTSDPSWVRILQRKEKTTTVPDLPWPVPNALYGSRKLLRTMT